MSYFEDDGHLGLILRRRDEIHGTMGELERRSEGRGGHMPRLVLYGGSTSERIVFHTLNRAPGNRVERQYIDSEGERRTRQNQNSGGRQQKSRQLRRDPACMP